MRITVAAAAATLLLLACGERRSAVLLDASPPSDAAAPSDATLAPSDAGEPSDASDASDASVPPDDAGAQNEASLEDAPSSGEAGGPHPDAAAQDASYGTAAGSGAPCGAFEDACAPTSNAPPSFCGSVPASWHPFVPPTAALPYLERTWLQCSEGAFGIANAVAFNLGADGTYHVLVESPSGELVTAPDPIAFGTYTVLQAGQPAPVGPPGGAPPPPGWFELSFQSATVSYSPSPISAVLTDSPPMMLVETFTGAVVAYAPRDTTGWTVVTSPQPSPGTAFTAPAVCNDPDGGSRPDGGDAGAPDASTVIDDGGAGLVGDWISCSVPAPTYARADFAGVRIDASGTFEVLVWDGAGQIEPATDVFDTGWWSFGETFGPVVLTVQLYFIGLFNQWGGYPDPTTLPDRLTLWNSAESGTPQVFVRRGVTGL